MATVVMPPMVTEVEAAAENHPAVIPTDITVVEAVTAAAVPEPVSVQRAETEARTEVTAAQAEPVTVREVAPAEEPVARAAAQMLQVPLFSTVKYIFTAAADLAAMAVKPVQETYQAADIVTPEAAEAAAVVPAQELMA